MKMFLFWIPKSSIYALDTCQLARKRYSFSLSISPSRHLKHGKLLEMSKSNMKIQQFRHIERNYLLMQIIWPKKLEL